MNDQDHYRRIGHLLSLCKKADHFNLNRMIYIIDDDTNVRKSLELLMRSYELKCKAYGRGKEVLEDFRDEVPDLVILDLKMADMESRDFLKAMKELGISIPVVGITAQDEIYTREYCRKYGVKDVLLKPVDSKALMDIITYHGGMNGHD